jgi:HEAT repeat protein
MGRLLIPLALLVTSFNLAFHAFAANASEQEPVVEPAAPQTPEDENVEHTITAFVGQHFPPSILGDGLVFDRRGRPVETWRVLQWRTSKKSQFENSRWLNDLTEAKADVAKVLNPLMAKAEVTDPAAERYAMIMLRRGDMHSIPVLIDVLKRCHVKPKPEDAKKVTPNEMIAVDQTALAATAALWQLSGRKHPYSPDHWDKWWEWVQPEFQASHDPSKSAPAPEALTARIRHLVEQLNQDEEQARECLIATGQIGRPILLQVLQETVDRAHLDPNRPDWSAAIPLAWVIDEIRATEKLPSDLRYAYFQHRLNCSITKFQPSPIDIDAYCRALSDCPFADVCSILLAGPELANNEQSMLHWLIGNSHLVAVLMNYKTPWQDVTHMPFSSDIKPVDDPAKEMSDAADVLTQGLTSETINVRRRASQLADMVGFRTDARPQKLIAALVNGWPQESDDATRNLMVMALSRYDSPDIPPSISAGLKSDRQEILLSAVRLARNSKFTRSDSTQVEFAKIGSLTEDQFVPLRRAAVMCLQEKAPRLLDFQRLVKDPNDDIREACARALRRLHDPVYADILFALADDKKESIRQDAFFSIGAMKDKSSLHRLVPYLKDQKIHGFAASALAEAGGDEAMPLFMQELETGNDIGGMIYQHLTRISGEQLGSKPEPWLEWWPNHSARFKSKPKSAQCRIVDEATSQPVADERFDVRVVFRVRQSETTTEQTIIKVNMHECASEFNLLIPAVVVNHADYNNLLADIEVTSSNYEMVDGKFTVSVWTLMGDFKKFTGRDIRDFRVKRKKSD